MAIVQRLAPQYGVHPGLAYAVIRAESNFNPQAVSVKNAQGLMQLIPETAARFNVTQPLDPEQNIRGGLSYLRWLLAYFKGNVPLVLAAYNAGEGAVQRAGLNQREVGDQGAQGAALRGGVRIRRSHVFRGHGLSLGRPREMQTGTCEQAHVRYAEVVGWLPWRGSTRRLVTASPRRCEPASRAPSATPPTGGRGMSIAQGAGVGGHGGGEGVFGQKRL